MTYVLVLVHGADPLDGGRRCIELLCHLVFVNVPGTASKGWLSVRVDICEMEKNQRGLKSYLIYTMEVSPDEAELPGAPFLAWSGHESAESIRQ